MGKSSSLKIQMLMNLASVFPALARGCIYAEYPLARSLAVQNSLRNKQENLK